MCSLLPGLFQLQVLLQGTLNICLGNYPQKTLKRPVATMTPAFPYQFPPETCIYLPWVISYAPSPCSLE